VSYDVLVIGGGPAGSVLARRLALDGARVALLTGPAVAGCEGLSARTRDLLAAEGLEPARACLRGPAPRGGEWGAGRAVAGCEWLADRAHLATFLRGAAVAAGVVLRHGTVVHVQRRAAGWRVESRTAGTHEAPLLVDARGRRGPEQRGPLLLALGQSFRRVAAGAPRTRIHPLRDGWCWLVEERDAVWVQLVGRPRQRHPAEWLAAAVAQIPALASALEGATATAPAIARPAHARLGRPSEDAALWRVGDAALALDPLSGQGVYEALRGARLVATALRSVLDGGDAGLARRFVAERGQDTWRRAVAAAAAFYGENAARGAFWSQTADAYTALVPPLPARAPSIERRPVLEDGRIRERPVLVTTAQPRGVWQVDGVPIVDLLEYLRLADGACVTGAATALARPPAAVASAVRWLAGAGTLPSRGAPPISAGG